nr:cytosolic sulfotransferase 5-like [Tanacetum cinerariifolium]
PELEVRKLAAFMEMSFSVEEEEKGVVEAIVKICSYENLTSLEVNNGCGGGQKLVRSLQRR